MAFENDWLMKQMTGSAHMIGKIFQLEISHLDLELVEDQEGRLIKGEDYLDALIVDEQFDEAMLYVKSQMSRLNSVQYDLLLDRFLLRLRDLDKVVLERNQLDSSSFQEIENHLRTFDW